METKATKIISKNKWTTIKEDIVLFSDGRESTYTYVERKSALIIIPLLKDGEKYQTILVEQFRYPVKKSLWQFPAGTHEEGKSESAHAIKELEEETGYTCDAVEKIGEFYLDPGLNSQKAEVFVAPDVQKMEIHTKGEDEEIQNIKKVPLEEMDHLIKNKELEDGLCISSVYFLKRYLRKSSP